jgi:hypothetical protein
MTATLKMRQRTRHAADADFRLRKSCVRGQKVATPEMSQRPAG